MVREKCVVDIHHDRVDSVVCLWSVLEYGVWRDGNFVYFIVIRHSPCPCGELHGTWTPLTTRARPEHKMRQGRSKMGSSESTRP